MLSANRPTRFLPALAALVLLAFGAVQAAPTGLVPYSAEYKIKISVLSGQLTARLIETGDGYVAVHKVTPTGMARMLVNGEIEETSGFAVDESGVRPLRYQSRDTMTKDKTDADFQFDWVARSITGVVNGSPVTIDFDGRAHDRISIQYAMMRDMIVGAADDSYLLFDIDKFKTLQITRIGTKEVEVPAGRYTAIGIRHQAEGSSRVTTLWCVPELDYLPAIIEQHRKGKLKMRATLERYVPESVQQPAAAQVN